MVVNARFGFYRIRLFTGEAKLIGRFDERILDIALPLNQ
jgi:hypothetical protein